MPLFTYKIKKSDGTVIEEKKDATDKFALYRDLRKDGETIVSVTESRLGKSIIRRLSEIATISARDKIMFTKNTAAMLEAGLALSRVLAVDERQTKNKKLIAIINSIGNDIKSGTSLSDSLKRFPEAFTGLYVAMVRAGEEGGTLVTALKLLSSQMEKTNLLAKRVRGAMIYPTIVLLAMITVAILMLIYLVPTLTATFKELNVALPITTRALIFTSDFLKNHYLIFFVGVCSLIIAFYLVLKNAKTKKILERLFLVTPFVGSLIKQTNSARMGRTLASLLESGVDFVKAMDITADVVQNSLHKAVIIEARKNVERGEPISSVFSKNEHLYPIFVGEMMSVGEETGKLAEMLNSLALYYENEVEQKTKDLSTIIEPVLMLVIGAGVGFFAISMIQPMYSVLSNV